MSENLHHLIRSALISQTLGKVGPLRLQRAFYKAQREMPNLPLDALLAEITDLALAPDGEAQLEKLTKAHIRVLSILDSDYPLMLKQVPDPPLLLFYCGEVQALHRPAVAIVGSRKCSAYGLGVAATLAAELARLGFVIVSGLAHGIDTRAHQACLEAGGRTVAVLGSGPDRIYPSSNRELARQMVRNGGAVASEFPPETLIKPFHFPIRNRIISGLCHATIIVEASAKSGSLVTARHCLEQSRELFAVPGPINRDESLGCNRLIAQGEARLLCSCEQVLAELAPLLGLAAQHRDKVNTAISDPQMRAIYEQLDAFEPTYLDVLVEQLKLPVNQVVASLMELETLGYVQRSPGACFVRNPVR